jgi:hypothetical protein
MVTEKEYLDAGLQTGIHQAVITFDFDNQLLYDAAYHKFYTIPQLEVIRKMVETSISEIINNNLDIEKENIKIRENRLSEFRDRVNTNQQKEKIHKPSWVYLAYDAHTGYWKIGYTTKVQQREKTLKLSNAKISIIHYFKGNYGLEKSLHETYKEFKIQGEWFSLNDDQIYNIVNSYK